MRHGHCSDGAGPPACGSRQWRLGVRMASPTPSAGIAAPKPCPPVSIPTQGVPSGAVLTAVRRVLVADGWKVGSCGAGLAHRLSAPLLGALEQRATAACAALVLRCAALRCPLSSSPRRTVGRRSPLMTRLPRTTTARTRRRRRGRTHGSRSSERGRRWAGSETERSMTRPRGASRPPVHAPAAQPAAATAVRRAPERGDVVHCPAGDPVSHDDRIVDIECLFFYASFVH